MQTEKAKSSHFDRTRGFKNQIFPTLGTIAPLEFAKGIKQVGLVTYFFVVGKLQSMQNCFRATLKIIRDIWRIVLLLFTIPSKKPNSKALLAQVAKQSIW